MVSKHTVSTTSVAVLAFTLFCAQVSFPENGTKSGMQAPEVAHLPEVALPKEDGFAGLERLDSGNEVQEVLEISKSGGLSLSLADHSYSTIAKRSSTAPIRSPVIFADKNTDQVVKKKSQMSKGATAAAKVGDISKVEKTPIAAELSKLAMQRGNMLHNKAILSCSDEVTQIVFMLLAIVGAIMFFTDVKEMVNTQQKLKSMDEISKTFKIDVNARKEDPDDRCHCSDAQDEREKKTPTAWFDLTVSDDAEKSSDDADYEDEWLGSSSVSGQGHSINESATDIPDINASMLMPEKALRTSSTSLPLWVAPMVVVNIAIQLYRVSTQLHQWPDEKVAQDVDPELELLAALHHETRGYFEVPTGMVLGLLLVFAALGSAVLSFDIRQAMQEEEETNSRITEVQEQDVAAGPLQTATSPSCKSSQPVHHANLFGLMTMLIIPCVGIVLAVLGVQNTSMLHQASAEQEVHQLDHEELIALTNVTDVFSKASWLPAEVVLSFFACMTLLGAVVFCFDLHAAMEEEAQQNQEEMAPKDAEVKSSASDAMWFDMTVSDEPESAHDQATEDICRVPDPVVEQDLQGIIRMPWKAHASLLMALAPMLMSILGALGMPQRDDFSDAVSIQQEIAQPAFDELHALAACHGASTSTSAPTWVVLTVGAVITILGAAAFYKDLQAAIEEELEEEDHQDGVSGDTSQPVDSSATVQPGVRRPTCSTYKRPFATAICLACIAMFAAKYMQHEPMASAEPDTSQLVHEELLMLAAKHAALNDTLVPSSLALTFIAIASLFGAAVFWNDVETAMEEVENAPEDLPQKEQLQAAPSENQAAPSENQATQSIYHNLNWVVSVLVLLLSVSLAVVYPKSVSLLPSEQHEAREIVNGELLAIAGLKHGTPNHVPTSVVLTLLGVMTTLGAAVFYKDVQMAIDEAVNVQNEVDCQPTTEEEKICAEGEGSSDLDSTDEGASSQSEVDSEEQ